jgi:hypothetical protein
MKLQRVRTRPDVFMLPAYRRVVQATEYTVCDDLSGFPLRRRPRFFRIAQCPLDGVRELRRSCAHR